MKRWAICHAGDTITKREGWYTLETQRMSNIDSLSKRELLTLLETLGQVSAESDQQKLVQTILETACRMTNSPDGSVLLFDAERNGLFFAAAQGEKARDVLEAWAEKSSQRVPLTGSNAGQAFTTGEIIVDKQFHRFKEVDRQTGKRSESILSVPLRSGNEPFGSFKH